MWGCCQLRLSPRACLQAIKGPLHPSSCINDIIWCSLQTAQSADVPSMKEPSGLLRTDGKRPDGDTLIPWSAGRYMAWDATVVHTCAASYLSQTAISVSSAAEQAAIRKTAKYALLPATY